MHMNIINITSVYKYYAVLINNFNNKINYVIQSCKTKLVISITKQAFKIKRVDLSSTKHGCMMERGLQV